MYELNNEQVILISGGTTTMVITEEFKQNLYPKVILGDSLVMACLGALGSWRIDHTAASAGAGFALGAVVGLMVGYYRSYLLSDSLKVGSTIEIEG